MGYPTNWVISFLFCMYGVEGGCKTPPPACIGIGSHFVKAKLTTSSITCKMHGYILLRGVFVMKGFDEAELNLTQIQYYS